MDRREFLRLSGRAAAASLGLSSLATACHSVTRPTPTPRVTRSGPSPSRPVPSVVPATDADWEAFGSRLKGTLVRPGDEGYGAALQLFDSRFDRIHPQGIAYCQTAGDVRKAIAFARDHGVQPAARSGGHSYGGYSITEGLVIDVTRMANVAVEPDGETTTVGAGARLVDVYAALAEHGVAIPGGSCPTVGITGLTLGGGIGVIGRKFGLTCDNVEGFDIVTADGRLLRCAPGANADLFWACRGGGGGNFGVVTSWTFRIHSLSTVTVFGLHWPWPAATRVVSAWQAWAPKAPDELWSNCHLLSNRGGATPLLSVGGAYVGTAAGLTPLLQTLMSSVGESPTSRSVVTHSFLSAMLVEAGCSGKTVAQCHLPTQNPAGTLDRQPFVAASDFFDRPLSTAQIGAFVRAVERRQASPLMPVVGGVAFDAFGGAINRVAPDATAFVHRRALFSGQYAAPWAVGDGASTVRANESWLEGLYATVHPFGSGFAYQNYIDPGLADWQHAYYGDNLPRLRQVKAKYDPHDVFRFAQSIPPA